MQLRTRRDLGLNSVEVKLIKIHVFHYGFLGAGTSDQSEKNVWPDSESVWKI